MKAAEAFTYVTKESAADTLCHVIEQALFIQTARRRSDPSLDLSKSRFKRVSTQCR
jgi:hypothetical protein